MNEAEYKVLEAWSRDAVALLEASGLSTALAKMQREAIDKHTDTPAIFAIAEDLAEGISELPSPLREIAQDTLKRSHGFGHEFFTDARMKSVMTIVKRRRIRNEEEYRKLLDFATDTTIDNALCDVVRRVLAAHEARLSAPSNQK